MNAHVPRKKLIEVALPLEAINAASAREKSIRHGHPSTLHLWWARRPLAACRAVLFAQLVDDPSAWPDRFPTEEAQDAERRRLHKVIERMVPWEASNDEAILNDARWEIARSVAWGLGEEPPPREDGKAILDYLQAKAPPVYDPFSGGGSIPLEAQRLGLRAYGSDLNPVAVLIGKALVEIPPKFAGLPPVNPKAQAELKRGGCWNGKGAQGLAEDVRYYGQWMRDEAERRVGHLYPKAKLPDGSDATVIAWLWARTVRSPDPAAKGAMVPLVSSFVLTSKGSMKTWVEPILDPSDPDGWRFEVRTGAVPKADELKLSAGTKAGRGSNFVCTLTGSPIEAAYIKAEASAGRMRDRLMATIVEQPRGRLYLSPDPMHERVANTAEPDDSIADIPSSTHPQYMGCASYGIVNVREMFTKRQRVALSTLASLVEEAFVQIEASARNAGVAASRECAQAICTYLGLIVGRSANYWSQFNFWSGDFIVQTFARQALSIVWDHAEVNPFSSSTGNLGGAVDWTAKALEASAPALGFGSVIQLAAQNNNYPASPVVISTDPPYYDNIPYADLSDFFYAWLRLSLRFAYPELMRRISVPKDDELVADMKRHGGRGEADEFFMSGMASALSAMNTASDGRSPSTIYYAFKQTNEADEGVSSTGWASFLQAVVDSRYIVDGTWPIRTERPGGNRNSKRNSLASSVVLVCRTRDPAATIITRADFLRALRRELPQAIETIRKAGVGPVDMQQSVIGPGMGVFSRHAKVLEDDDSPMTVKTALALINRVWEEIENELDAAFDAETQVALAWYASYGFDARPSGELIMLTTAKNTSDRALFHSGVFEDRKGKTALTAREDLPVDWTPASDRHLTVWECVQHTARVLNATEGGTEAAARLVAQMGPKSADARKLAYRLFEIATQRGWSAEALVYNELAEVWPKLEDLASTLEQPASASAAQPGLFEEMA